MKIHSVKYNFIMNFIMTASSILFPLITFPYVSRVLLPVGNGKITFVSSVTAYFTLFASLGIPTYGIRVCARLRDDKEKLSKTVQEILIINSATMLIACGVFLLSVLTVPEFYEEKELFLIHIAGMVMNMLAMTWLYNALEQYDYITVCNLAVKAVSLALMFLMVKKPEDYILYGGITMFASSASYLFNFVYARRFITFRKSGPYEFRKHLKPILVFFAMSAAINVYTNLDVVMLRFMKGNEEVGYYNTAIKVKTILSTMITSLGTVLLPRLSYYIKKDQKEAFYQTIAKAVNFVMVLGVPLMCYFIMFAKESVLLLAGREYMASVIPMMILMPTVLLIGLSNITGIQVLTPQDEEKKVLYSILGGAGADFLLNLILIPKYASSGAAFATVMAEFVVLAVQCAYLRSMVGDVIKKVNMGKIAAATLLAVLAGWCIKRCFNAHVFVTLAVSACLFFGVYGTALLGMKEKFVWETLRSMLNTKG